jgi:predicted DNA-binding ribbon-helix-helix protein
MTETPPRRPKPETIKAPPAPRRRHETESPTVGIIRLSVHPITTPDYPDPTPIAREVRCGDRTATLCLEDAAWNALCRIARQQGRTVDALCADIEKATAPGASFAQAARYYVFDHIAAPVPDRLLPPELRDLRCHGYPRTIQ